MRKHLLLLITAFIVAFQLQAQITADADKPLPVDPKVRTGTLSNGMKYYVRYNAKPEHRAELRLAVNAGSTSEEDNQQGLAHFNEHMAFNGTKNFTKNDVVNYIESIGMKFGADLNAYTSFDETVYKLQVPTDTEKILLKGFEILDDWAHNLSFDSVEIDKERGVVIEEWRLGQGAQERMRRKFWPVLFKDSRYAERLPIGKKEILENTPHAALTQFYKDWYRPDLMAVVAVGDFDVDKIEKLIKEKFSAIPSKQNERPMKSWDVPDQKDLAVAIASDKESPYTVVLLEYKLPVEHEITQGDFRRDIIEGLYTSMINQRLSELQKLAEPPFLYASTNFGNEVRTKNAYSAFAVVKDGGVEKGLTTLIAENERVKRFGFTEGEFDRAKKEYMRGVEKQFNEKDKTESTALVQEYLNNFLEKEAIPGIEYEYNLTKEILPSIKVSEVSALAKKWVTENGANCVAIVMAPDKEGVTLPTDDNIKSIFKSASSTKLEAYVDKTVNKPLLSAVPKPSKVAEQKEIKEFGITELKLANGVHVFLKPTDFKNDEILFTSYSFGGTSIYPDKDYESAAFSDNLVEEGGVGDFDKTSLEKALAGKIVSVSPSVGELTQGINGSCSPQDIETAMQLIYLYFTDPRKDSTAYLSLMEKQKGFLENRQSVPEQIFSDTVQYAMSSYNYRSRPQTVDMLKEVSLSRSYAIYKDRFADASSATFTFVGNFKVDEIKPLIEKYLGGLPSTGRKETYKDLGIAAPKGKLDKTVKKGVEPKSSVSLKFTGTFDYTRQRRNEMNALMKLLNIKLREDLREDKSGVYGVGCYPALQHYPKGTYQITIGFGCAPEKVESLIEAAISEIDDVKKNGCNAANLTKIKETFIRERETYLKQNNFWLNTISTNAMNGENILDLLEYNKWVNSLNADDFKTWANQYFNMNEYKRFVLSPEK